MSAATEIYFDVVGNRLVSGLNSKDTLVLKWFQGMSPVLKCFPVMPTGRAVDGPFFKKIYASGHSMELAVGPAAGSEAIKAAQYTWTAVPSADSDGLSGYFTATLNLNTDAMNTAVGSSDKFDTIAEFRLLLNGTLEYIVQANVSILAVVKDPGSAASVPTPAAEYLKVSDALGMFPLWDNRNHAANAGRNIIFVSPGTAALRELGVADDSSAIDNAYLIA